MLFILWHESDMYMFVSHAEARLADDPDLAARWSFGYLGRTYWDGCIAAVDFMSNVIQNL